MTTKGCNIKTDEQLIREYQNGDNNSLGLLYNRYYSKVFNKCLSLTKNPDDAFDCAQDVLMKAFSNVSSFKGNSKFSTWLYAITHNYCITWLSKVKKNFFQDINSNLSNTENCIGDEDFENRRQREKNEQILETYLENIPEPDRQLLNRKYRENSSIKELQEELSLSASAVKMRLMRARQKLENMFASAS